MNVDQLTPPNYGFIGGTVLLFLCICALGTVLAVAIPALDVIEDAPLSVNG
jgi:hypothetical protein